MECKHECSACSASCGSAEPAAENERAPLCRGASVKKVVAVGGGKGGAGRSVMSCLIASELARRGLRAGILDADITGASVAHYMGAREFCRDSDECFFPVVKDAVQLASVELALGDKPNPTAWRANTASDAVLMFWSEMRWDNVDVLLVDLPADIGDIALTVYQALPVDATVLVARESVLSVTAALRSGVMSLMSSVPVIAAVINRCGGSEREAVSAAIGNLCRAFRLPNAIRCPYSAGLVEAADLGELGAYELGEVSLAADAIQRLL